MINISLGSVSISFSEIIKALSGNPMSKESWEHILFQYRIPKSITAISVGSGLAVSGLLMQTLFRNPMAGPSVLGISSGAGLGVALLVMGGSFLGIQQHYNITTLVAAIIGAFSVLFVVLVLSLKLKNNLSVLIIGLMLGALTTSVVSILAYFSNSTDLQEYIFWSFGSLGNLNYSDLGVLNLILIIGFLAILPLLKVLNSFILGENYAQSLGVNIQKTKTQIIIIVGIITGVITAFVGPIAFIGLAVPHLARLLFKTSNHKILFPASLLIGSIVLLNCDSIAQLPFNDSIIPINAVTSLFGAPLVIWLLIKNKKYNF